MSEALPTFASDSLSARPSLVPPSPGRAANKNIPPTALLRREWVQAARKYAHEHGLTSPLREQDLLNHANALSARLACDRIYRDFLAVILNNEIWRGPFAEVPFARRLLLLPKCLRHETECSAHIDEFGLLCQQCGLCSIRDITQEAERLGYVVLVAEGSAMVMSLIKAGKIDAILGVSCLNVLKQAFPYMEAAGIPGAAIPLLQDDCQNTQVDLEWVWEYLHLTTGISPDRLDLGKLRQEVESWFGPDSLERMLGPVQDASERIARDWLTRSGKRWRPFLTAAACQALTSPLLEKERGDICAVGVAIECFHKASLVHDDIEDNDALRYGEKTLHEEFGMPVALNVGDLLIGEGYRLLASCHADPATKADMLRVAAEGQRELCRGQGKELMWNRSRGTLTPMQVLDIFRQKTAPAFEVALRLGAIYAGKHQECATALTAFSQALGIAYQIRDDLHDLSAAGEVSDIKGLRPSLVIAVARERAEGPQRLLLDQLWSRNEIPDPATVEALCRDLQAQDHCQQLLEQHKEEAIQELNQLKSASLRGLLRRVVGRIFNDAEIKGWCREQQQRQA